MKKTIVFALLLCCFVILTGCNSSKQPYVIEGTSKSISLKQAAIIDDEINEDFDTSLIYPGITLGEVSKLLSGQSIPSGKSVNYPIYRSWSIGNGKVLEIGFCVVGDSPLDQPTETLHVISEEEAAELKDWFDGFKAISAHIIENGKVTATLIEGTDESVMTTTKKNVIIEKDSRYTYASVDSIKVGMSWKDVYEILPENSYISCIGAGYFVNDYETNHIYNITFDFRTLTVSSIEDTGVCVGYVSPKENLGRLKQGMTMKEIVEIIGVPTGMPTSGVIVYVWNIEDYNHQVALQFHDGEMMILDRIIGSIYGE